MAGVTQHGEDRNAEPRLLLDLCSAALCRLSRARERVCTGFTSRRANRSEHRYYDVLRELLPRVPWHSNKRLRILIRETALPVGAHQS